MSTRTRSITIPVVVTLRADAWGDVVTDTVVGAVNDTHPVFTADGEQLIAPNTVRVARRHLLAMVHKASTEGAHT